MLTPSMSVDLDDLSGPGHLHDCIDDAEILQTVATAHQWLGVSADHRRLNQALAFPESARSVSRPAPVCPPRCIAATVRHASDSELPARRRRDGPSQSLLPASL